MFYVGAYSTFHGKDKVETTKVKLLEKFGPHLGRAKRWLDAHKPKEIEGERFRAIAFALPRGFRLSNDVVRDAVKRFKCDWQTAKFHVYREQLVDVIGNKEDWQEYFPAEEKKDDAGNEPGIGHEGLQKPSPAISVGETLQSVPVPTEEAAPQAA